MARNTLLPNLSWYDRRFTEQNNHNGIGEQVIHLRWTMTKCSGHCRTDSSLIVQNWKCPREGFRSKRRIYLYFLRIVVIVNRKMRKLFIIVHFRNGDFQKKISPPLGNALKCCFLFVMLRDEASRNNADIQN